MTLEENIINVQAHLMGLSERVGRLEYQVRSLVVGPQILERVRVLESMVKELIIELNAGSDAVGTDRWLELSGPYLEKQLRRRSLHEANWPAVRAIAQIVCDEEKKDDYDYIFYINRGRRRVKGEESAAEEVS